MATATLSVVFMGLVGIVLQDPTATMTNQDIPIALVDGAQVSGTQHHPVLVVDLDLVSSANGMPTGIDQSELPRENWPHTIADPVRPGHILLVWPLEGLSVSFGNLVPAAEMQLELGMMPNLYKAANNSGNVARKDLDLARNGLLLSLVTLKPGLKLAQADPKTSEKWCFSSNTSYLDYFYTAASYSAAFDITKEVVVTLTKPLLNGKSPAGKLTLRKAQAGDNFKLAISNDATLDHDMLSADNLHAQALCALVGLKADDDKKCPWPRKESGGLCTGGGGTGTGLGCSPFTIKGN